MSVAWDVVLPMQSDSTAEVTVVSASLPALIPKEVPCAVGAAISAIPSCIICNNYVKWSNSSRNAKKNFSLCKGGQAPSEDQFGEVFGLIQREKTNFSKVAQNDARKIGCIFLHFSPNAEFSAFFFSYFVPLPNTSNLLFPRSSSTAGTIAMMLSIEEQANTVREFIIKCSGQKNIISYCYDYITHLNGVDFTQGIFKK